MGLRSVCLWRCVFLCAVYAAAVHGYDYRIEYFEQNVDHFSYENQDTFQMRYVISDEYWNSTGGPVFFYCGNEMDIISFVENTGFMWENAPEFGAMVIFAEHRYYGESLPYADESFTDPSHYGYLTVEQALADFAVFLRYMRDTTEGMEDSPVIAFGGSYGGMLAAYIRMKYPNIVAGALASSAPILGFEDLTPCESYYAKVTSDYYEANSSCPALIKESWTTIDEMAETESGREELTEIFHLCDTIEDSAGLKSWLSEVYFYMAMLDYPYPTTFVTPLPGWPVNVACGYLSDPDLAGTDLLDGVYHAVSVYENYTGSSTCFDITDDGFSVNDDAAWLVQCCNELVMPMCDNGIDDMFELEVWDLAEYIEECEMDVHTTPRPDWIVTEFGGDDIGAASNIIFSNGNLDPWSAGGVRTNISDTLIAILIEESAHHLDIRSSDPADPVSVTDARIMEKAIIWQWIREFHEDLENHE